MNGTFKFKRFVSVMLAVVLCLAALLPIGCADTVPDSSTPESSAESTPNESTPTEPGVSGEEYSISYDLDGGIDGGNPATYNSAVGVTLTVPVRPGYDFAGWTGTGLTEATKLVTVAAGTTGDLSFTATWTENGANRETDTLDPTYMGKDDGLTANPNELGVSVPDKTGSRDEGLFTLKTVYTDIAIDGTMDAAYTYGLRFTMQLTTDDEYYADRETTFDAYVVRGQDGFIYVYAVIIDHDLVVNEHIFKNDGAWRVDSIDMYIELGNYGIGHQLYSFVPDPAGKLKRDMPERTNITIIEDTGYVVEFAFDNNGKPFFENDEIGFGFYLNDANDWNPETKKYRKEVTKNASVLNPVGTDYVSPSPVIHDAFRVSHQSATGKVDMGDKKAEKTGEMFTDMLSGAGKVALVYDENANGQAILTMKDIASILRGSGADVYIVKEGSEAAEQQFDYYILFNMTTHKATEELLAALKYNEYGVSVTENAIAMIGWNEAASAQAYDILYEIIEYGINGGKVADLGALYKGGLDYLVGDDIPALDGLDSVTDVGEDAYLLYKLTATVDDYTAYNKKLEDAGYKLYTTNEIATAKFATYYNDTTVVSVQFGGDSDKSLRVVVEPLANTALPMLEKPEDADATVTVSSISQLNPHHFCMVIQLSNGHFIVIDSGNNGRQKDLSDFLRAKAPDGKPVVEAWIFTHFHQDHIGGFVDYTGVSSLMRYITIKSVIYNFPQTQIVNTASSNDLSNMKKWSERIMPALREKGTTFYQARTGQKYYFGNAEIEILWTFEDIMPFNIFTDVTNHTCIGFTVNIAGQKIMITGDSTEQEFRMVANKYGETLKSDMVQLAHHGGGNGGGDHDFYKLVNAPIVFHPNESEKYPSVGSNEKWAIKNAQLVIRTGNYGTATLKLPFTVGDEIEAEKTPVDELKK